MCIWFYTTKKSLSLHTTNFQTKRKKVKAKSETIENVKVFSTAKTKSKNKRYNNNNLRIGKKKWGCISNKYFPRAGLIGFMSLFKVRKKNCTDTFYTAYFFIPCTVTLIHTATTFKWDSVQGTRWNKIKIKVVCPQIREIDMDRGIFVK